MSFRRLSLDVSSMLAAPSVRLVPRLKNLSTDSMEELAYELWSRLQQKTKDRLRPVNLNYTIILKIGTSLYIIPL